jgi:hypothetical protein
VIVANTEVYQFDRLRWVQERQCSAKLRLPSGFHFAPSVFA